MPLKDLEARTAYRKAQAAALVAAALCVDCREPVDRDPEARKRGRRFTRCLACCEKRRVRIVPKAALKRAEWRAHGLCGRCGKVQTGGTYCEPCRLWLRDRYHSRYREKRITDHRIAHQALKLLVFEKYGGARCACCEETHMEFLSIDHINGDGTAHRKLIGWVAGNIYGWLKKNGFPSGFRVLCMNCNFALGHVGYCPHEREQIAAAEMR